MATGKSFAHDPDAQPWTELIAAHLRGEKAGSDAIAARLEPQLRQATASFLGPDDPDVDDVVAESLLAVLDYLECRGEFQGDLMRFGVTVAVNRCRNLRIWRQRKRLVPLDPLVRWIANPAASPLDLLLAAEQRNLLQQALTRLGPDCRHLLRAHYLESRSIESIRAELGLESVQAVYYRRGVCLKKALHILNEKLGRCSDSDKPARDPRSPEGGGVHD